MCIIHNCNQNSYYESKEGECYYHWKIRLGLITKSTQETITNETRRNEYFNKYSNLIHYIIRQSHGIADDEREDLTQHLLMWLWLLTSKIKSDASEPEVYNFIRLSCNREAKYFINNLKDNEKTSIENLFEDVQDVHLNPSEVFEKDNLEEFQNGIIKTFITQTLNPLESMLFVDLFLTEETKTIRDLGEKYNKSHEWVRKYGTRLYNRFKEYMQVMGYNAFDFI